MLEVLKVLEVLEVLGVLGPVPLLEVLCEVWSEDRRHSLEEPELSLGVWGTGRGRSPRERAQG